MSDKDEKTHFHTVTSTWTESIEKVIKDIGESCEGYKWMNIFAAKKTSRIYNILMYTLIFMGPLSGVLSTMSTVDEKDNSKTIQIIVTILSFISGVISTVIKFSRFEQKSISHKTVASKYASLEGNIRRQLSLYRDERVNAGNYLEWVSISFDDLFISTPLISDEIYQKWVEFAKQNGLHIPEQLGNTIEVAEVSHLNNIGKIGINKSESVQDLRNSEHSPFEVVIQGKDTMKRQRERGETCNTIHDLNRFADKAMQYEMKRLQNFRT